MISVRDGDGIGGRTRSKVAVAVRDFMSRRQQAAAARAALQPSFWPYLEQVVDGDEAVAVLVPQAVGLHQHPLQVRIGLRAVGPCATHRVS